MRDLDNPGDSSRQYLVRIKSGTAEYEGTLFNPFPDMRLSEHLGRPEGFLNLKDAREVTTDEKYPFVVINKKFVEIIKVIDER